MPTSVENGLLIISTTKHKIHNLFIANAVLSSSSKVQCWSEGECGVMHRLDTFMNKVINIRPSVKLRIVDQRELTGEGIHGNGRGIFKWIKLSGVYFIGPDCFWNFWPMNIS